MEISKKMQDAFNAQIKNEFWSSNLYMEMAFWFRKEGWRGFSNWMFHQSQEEREHALEMANFVLHRGGEAVMTGFEEVPTSFENPQAVFELTLKHEQKVTELINALADVADEEKDRASQNFIAKFIDEQVEEEKNVRDILDKFTHSSGHAVTFIDAELGARQ